MFSEGRYSAWRGLSVYLRRYHFMCMKTVLCKKFTEVITGRQGFNYSLSILLEGEGGSRQKHNEFPFFREVELLTWSLRGQPLK